MTTPRSVSPAAAAPGAAAAQGPAAAPGPAAEPYPAAAQGPAAAPGPAGEPHPAAAQGPAPDPAPAAPARPPAGTGTPTAGPRPVRPRWLAVGAAAWGLLLLGLAVLSAHRSPPTVREQRAVGQAAPVVDRAIGELVAAAGPDAAPVVGPRRLTTGCRLTSAWAGAAVDRSVTFHVAETDGPALLDRIAAGLPAGHRARVSHRAGRDGHALRADAGEFVTVTGGVTSAGVVSLTASSGCRPPSPGLPAGRAGAGPDTRPDAGQPTDAAPVRLLTGLGAAAVTGQAGESVPCPGGGRAYTARALGRGAPAAAALERAAGPGAVVIVARPDRYVYRAGAQRVVVWADGDELTATVTTGC
ncbi:MAG TPA: hypothetical protein VNV66_21620 [Pilimelia sp.]|nr:hypothetical protein [Pilimelia sp.]